MTDKLNRRDRPYVIADEIFPLTDGAGAGFLAHDFVDLDSLEVYTQPGRAGERVLNYTTEVREGLEWKVWLRVFGPGEAVYVSYQSAGDMVEAEDVNRLQRAVSELDTALGAAGADLARHQARRDNPHGVTKADVGLGRADDTPDGEKPVSAAQLAAIREAREGAAAELALHGGRRDNPHQVGKDQVGLSHVEDVLQASKAEFDAHVGDRTHHLTQAERQTWGDKYTRAEVENLLAGLVNDMDWKESVETYADIATAYPAPEDGWTVNVKDANVTYRYDGTAWVAISANAIPKATAAVDGLMTKEDKAALDGAVGVQHSHTNKAVLDGITSALVDAWNTVTGKVDKVAGKGLSANDYTDAEKAKLAGLQTTNEQTPVFTQAATRANLVSGEKLPVLLGKLMRWFSDLKAVAWSGSYNDLSDKPTGLPPGGAAGGDLEGSFPNPSVKDNSHAHTIANVTGLQGALDGKAAASHTHAISGVTGLQAVLDGKLSAGGLTWDDLKGGGGG